MYENVVPPIDPGIQRYILTDGKRKTVYIHWKPFHEEICQEVLDDYNLNSKASDQKDNVEKKYKEYVVSPTKTKKATRQNSVSVVKN